MAGWGIAAASLESDKDRGEHLKVGAEVSSSAASWGLEPCACWMGEGLLGITQGSDGGRGEGSLGFADEEHGFLTQEHFQGWGQPCLLQEGAGGSLTCL